MSTHHDASKSPRPVMLIEEDDETCCSRTLGPSHYPSSSLASAAATSSSSPRNLNSKKKHQHCGPSAPSFFSFPCNPQDMRRQKRKFLVFVRILVGYLERKDPLLCQRVRSAVRDCSKRNRRREPGYESAVISIHTRLRSMVSQYHWMRAQDYMHFFFHQHQGAYLPVVPPDDV